MEKFRDERREADVGRRGGGRAPRWPRQSQPVDADAGRRRNRLRSLRDELISAHRERFGSNADGDLYLGLQITHSGRFARPDIWDKPAPIAACHHPILDRRFPSGVRVFTDDELDRLVDDYICGGAAGLRLRLSVRRCEGLSRLPRPRAARRDHAAGQIRRLARKPDAFHHRRSFSGIRSAVPGLAIVVRVSIFDMVPHRKGAGGVGVPEQTTGQEPGFGVMTGEDMDGALDGRTRPADAPRGARRPMDLHFCR